MPHECEICGSIHDTEGGLVSHLQNKEDDAHAEFDSRKICWRHVMERNGELASASETVETTSAPIESETAPVETTSVETSEPECPDCGSRRYYDAGEVLAAGSYSQEETKELIEGDHVCAACNEVY